VGVVSKASGVLGPIELIELCGYAWEGSEKAAALLQHVGASASMERVGLRIWCNMYTHKGMATAHDARGT